MLTSVTGHNRHHSVQDIHGQKINWCVPVFCSFRHHEVPDLRPCFLFFLYSTTADASSANPVYIPICGFFFISVAFPFSLHVGLITNPTIFLPTYYVPTVCMNILSFFIHIHFHPLFFTSIIFLWSSPFSFLSFSCLIPHPDLTWGRAGGGRGGRPYTVLICHPSVPFVQNSLSELDIFPSRLPLFLFLFLFATTPTTTTTRPLTCIHTYTYYWVCLYDIVA